MNLRLWGGFGPGRWPARHPPPPARPFEPLPLLHNNFAVVVGLIYVELPFMVLPLYAALDRLDRSPPGSQHGPRRRSSPHAVVDRQIFHQTHITPLASEGSRRRRGRHQPHRQEVSRLGGRGAEAQFLQLGHLYRRDDARRLQGGERHRRQYEPVCHQRRAVRQAARRQPRLRRHRSGQRVRPAHDPGQAARAARSRQDPEHQERRAGVHQRRALRSGPQVQHALYLARHRHRLSQVQGQGDPR